MRCILAGVIIIGAVASAAAALDLGIRAAEKSRSSFQPPAPDPEVIQQGGDTENDAIVLAGIPILISGSTVGYSDDFDEACPYDGSRSPDVVYRLVAKGNILVDIDLRDSSFDTKVYVYRENLTLVACNDDYHTDHTSRLEGVVLVDRMTYYVVVDGHGGDAGEFQLSIGYQRPCELACPDGMELEGEPPLIDGYVDAFNGGCNSVEQGTPVPAIEAWLFQGRSGWYRDAEGVSCRDTDWFAVTLPPSGNLDIWGDAEQLTYVAVVDPRTCDGKVLQSVLIGPCTEGVLSVSGEPGSTIRLWVAPMRFEGPHRGDREYSYVLAREDYLTSMSASAESWAKVRQLFH